MRTRRSIQRRAALRVDRRRQRRRRLARVLVALVAAILLPATARTQDPETAPAPKEESIGAGTSYDWGSWTWSQYMLKAGQDKKAVFGARLTGWLYEGRLTVAGDLDASATQDGGATEGSVNVLDPRTFQTGAFYLTAYYNLRGPLSVAAVAGISADVEGGRLKPVERYPRTLAGGLRLGFRGMSLFVLGGLHEEAGDGFKVGVRTQIPLKGRASFVGQGAFPGDLSYAMGGIALSLR